MKTYNVELKHTSYTATQVQAETEEQAKALAWEELKKSGDLDAYGYWELDSIEETT